MPSFEEVEGLFIGRADKLGADESAEQGRFAAGFLSTAGSGSAGSPEPASADSGAASGAAGSSTGPGLALAFALAFPFLDALGFGFAAGLLLGFAAGLLLGFALGLGTATWTLVNQASNSDPRSKKSATC